MSSQVNIEKPVEVKQTGQQPAGIVEKAGKILDRVVVEVKNQASKKEWQIAALVAGLVILVIGAFGAAGLLNSYGHLAMPQGLSSFVNTIGNSGLMAIAVGGLAVGGLLTGFGAYKRINTLIQQKKVVSPEEKAKIIDKNIKKNRDDYFKQQQIREENLKQHKLREEENSKKQQEKEAELAKQPIERGKLNQLKKALNQKTVQPFPHSNLQEKRIQSLRKEQEALEKLIEKRMRGVSLSFTREPLQLDATPKTYTLTQLSNPPFLSEESETKWNLVVYTPFEELHYAADIAALKQIKRILNAQGYRDPKNSKRTRI